jgi:glyoxylase-like metal-dependent hydrolase (beta-lactamase superfamily II)
MVCMSTTHTLTPPVSGLRASPPESLPFAPELEIRAYVLERPQGNLLVYNAGTVADAGFADVAWVYLNHWHEAMFRLRRTVAALGDPYVVAHAADAAQVERRSGIAPVTFDHAGGLGEGFELLPIPGHTPGSTAFLWEHDGRRVLFSGDQLYLRDGEWVAAVLDTSDRDAYVASLERLREVEFDVLVPWAATAGRPPYALTDPDDARARIDEVLARVRAGESG